MGTDRTTIGKSSWWSITINNPTEEDMETWRTLANADTIVREVVGQLEEGEDGTRHIQGAVHTSYGRYFKKLKQLLPRAHIEPAKNPTALVNYVQKPETRIAEITTEKKATIKTASQADVQNALYDLLEHNGSHYIKEWNHKEEYHINLSRCRWEIRDKWESLTDTVVSQLICDGYYGIEFVMANPQVRTAFKKYLPDILFRTWKERNYKIES